MKVSQSANHVFIHEKKDYAVLLTAIMTPLVVKEKNRYSMYLYRIDDEPFELVKELR